MGRSVSYLTYATKVWYCAPKFSDGSDDVHEESYEEWEFFRDDLTEQLIEKFPSLSPPNKDKWCGNETKIILQNYLIEVGLSEYCGLVSISMRPRQDDGYYETQGIAEQWIHRVSKSVEAIIKPYNGLSKMGTFSNGEAIFSKL